MKLMDLDGLFDKKLARYMQENKGKHTEKEWENVIPRLYKQFGDTYVAKLQCTPREYYARMTNEELAETLQAHLAQDVPVPEFLCAELEGRNAADVLLPLFRGADAQTAAYVVNLLGDDVRAFDAYFDALTENRFDEELRSDLTDVLRLHADEVKSRALALYRQGVAQAYMLEILSRVKRREEEIFQTLLQAFQTADETQSPVCAGYLAAYGDERALPYLTARIEDESIGFVEFQELKYAIEALGGEYAEQRDFSEDKDYLAIEAASAAHKEEPQS